MDNFINPIMTIYYNNFDKHLQIHNFKKRITKYKYYDLWLTNDIYNYNYNNYNTYFNVNDKLMGFAFFNYYEKYKILHLDYISLDIQFQGKGNGSKYLLHLIDTFIKNNKKVKYLILECEDKLIKFYEKNNFYCTKINYHFYDTKLNLLIYKNFSNLYYLYKPLIYFSNLFKRKNFYFSKNKESILNWLFYSIFISKKYKYHIFDNFIS